MSTSQQTKPFEAQASEPFPRPIMNIKEAAAYLRVSPSLVEKLHAKRKIKGAKLGRRLVFMREQLDRFVAVQTALAA